MQDASPRRGDAPETGSEGGQQVFTELFSSLPACSAAEQLSIQRRPARPHLLSTPLLRVNMLAEEATAAQTVGGEMGGRDRMTAGATGC